MLFDPRACTGTKMLIVVARMTACGDTEHMVNAVKISVNVFHMGNKGLTVSAEQYSGHVFMYDNCQLMQCSIYCSVTSYVRCILQTCSWLSSVVVKWKTAVT